MLTRLVRFFSGKPSEPAAAPVDIAPPVWLQPLNEPIRPSHEPTVDGDAPASAQTTDELEASTPPPETVSGPLDPGAPYAFGEPVPRWPEHGAAMVAATPEQLVDTQRELIAKMKIFSAMDNDAFDRMVLPAFHRYAAWVHLLPASEEHHHFGPGGLLAHGFEVALHATRLADGRQVGTDLTPAERAAFQPRWKVAAMLGGLLHDIGKPLVDCGATDPDRKITWSSASGPLYNWLQANRLTHYRFYWRPGKRHERHKPVGTSVTREIIGQELLEWLSQEPTQEVVNLMMTAIALGATPSNLMGQLVQKADEMSCDADLRRLAARTKGSGQGGLQGRAAVIMRELRNLLLNNQLEINKAGGDLFFTPDGCFGHHSNLMQKVIAAVIKKQLPHMPQKIEDFYTLLEDTGFIVGYHHEDNPDSNIKQTLFKLTLNPSDTNRPEVRIPFAVIRFVDVGMVLGNVPMPPLIDATYTTATVSKEEAATVEASVTIAGDTAEPTGNATTQGTNDGTVSSPNKADEAAGRSSGDSTAQGSEAAPASAEPYIANNRNRGDRVVSVENQRRLDQKAQERRPSLEAAFQKLENVGICGVVFVRLMQRIAAQQVAYGRDAFETGDGVALRWPAAFEDLSVPSAEALKLASDYKLLMRENGSSRDVDDRDFPDGSKSKSALLGGAFMLAWRALREEYPEIANGVVVHLDNEAIIEAAPSPAAASSGAQLQEQNGQGRRNEAKNQTNTGGKRTGSNAQGSQENRSPQQQSGQGARNSQRPPKPERPVTGAAPAPHRDQAPVNRENILATPNRPQQGRAQQSPVREAAAATTTVAANQQERSVERPGYTRKENLHGKSRIETQTISQLTDQRREEINGYCWLFARRAVLEGRCGDSDSMTLVTGLSDYADRIIHVRYAPLIEALHGSSNRAFSFSKPDTLQFSDIRDLRINPDYVPPEWVKEKYEALKQQLASRQGSATAGGSQ